MTLVLRDSLGGNCKTVMVATISGEAAQMEESISTCRFAQRVALVTNEVGGPEHTHDVVWRDCSCETHTKQTCQDVKGPCMGSSGPQLPSWLSLHAGRMHGPTTQLTLKAGPMVYSR
jgi:hypothetical protein